MQEKHFLNSWKEVADYVGRSARTLQRWEKNWKLPMHRPAGRMRSAVIAVASEIDEWIKQTPIARSADVARSSPIKPTVEELRPPAPSNGSNSGVPVLLCIDDDANSGALRKRFLEANGYEVLTASDGPSGVELFEQNRIALVVLNCCEESLDGEVVARMLKRRKPKVPIVMMTGVKDLPAAARQFADRVVTQGSGSDALLSTIRGWA